MRSAGLAVCAMALWVEACGGKGPALIRFNVPVSEGDRSVVIALEVIETSSLTASAYDLDAFPAFAAPLRSGNTGRITALVYDRVLDDLFIDPGPIATITRGPTRPLPAAHEIFGGQVAGLDVTPLSSLSTAPPSIAALRLPALEACVPLRASEHALPTPTAAGLALGVHIPEHPSSFKGAGVLVDTDGGPFYIESSTVAVLIPPPGKPCGDSNGAPFYSGYQSPSGTLWLGGDCGFVWSVDIDLAMKAIVGDVLSSATHRDGVVAVDGPTTAPLTELFILGSHGQVDRIDGVSLLGTNELVMSLDAQMGLAWIGPGEVIAVSHAEDHVHHFSGKNDALETLPQATGAPTAVARTLALGPVVGTATGELYARRHGEWSRLPGATPSSGVRAIAAYRSTFVVLYDDGGLRQYSTASGSLCAASFSLGATSGAQLIAVTDDSILLVGNPTGPTLAYRWLEP
jgi:hypothetical protein